MFFNSTEYGIFWMDGKNQPNWTHTSTFEPKGRATTLKQNLGGGFKLFFKCSSRNVGEMMLQFDSDTYFSKWVEFNQLELLRCAKPTQPTIPRTHPPRRSEPSSAP